MQNTGTEAYIALGDDINKPKRDDPTLETTEGVVSEKLPELTLDIPNDELVTLLTKYFEGFFYAFA